MSAQTSGPGGPRDVCGSSSPRVGVAEVGTPGPEQYLGRDQEVDYLVERWDDGSLTLATRPIGSARWSAPVRLVAG